MTDSSEATPGVKREHAPRLVVHVFPTFAVGGAQARFAALANRFGAEFRHRIVALDGDLGCAARLDPSLAVDFPVVEERKHAMWRNAWRFHRLLRQWRPDLLVTCNWGAIEFALANIWPVARHVHVVDGFGPEEQSSQIPRRVLIRRLALRKTTVALPSRNLVRIARDVWQLDPATVRYVPNGVDLTRFAGPPRAADRKPVTIGTVAALRAEKNLARLLRAVAALPSDLPVRLVIVGDGAERAGLEECAGALGLRERVVFTGHRDDTPSLYAGFDIFALSSDTEQMPLSLMEAMASGLPAVATDVGDVRGMLSEANGPFVCALDDAAMTHALARLVTDASLRARLGAENLAKARAEFDQDRMFAAWHGLWTGQP